MPTFPDTGAQHATPVAGRKIARFLIHRSFALLWIGQTVSLIGSQITGTGLQVAAILILKATPLQMSLLAALSALPPLLAGQLAGVWVDRLPRRPILIVADLCRALLLLSIPLAALAGFLRIEHFYLVTILTGLFSVFFDVAYRSFLPTLLLPEVVIDEPTSPKAQSASQMLLLEGNSKLSASESVAEIGGSALGGLLVQVLTAPIAILLDSVSFLVSALCLALIRAPEPRPVYIKPQRIWTAVREGWQALWRNSLLRALASCAVIWHFCSGTFATLYTLYVVRELGLAPIVYGVFVALGGVGALAGALVASQMTQLIGVGWLMIGGILLSAITSLLALLAALAGAPLIVITILLAASQLVGDIGLAFYFVNDISLRQTLVPDHLLGRVNACMGFLTGSALLCGSLLAGVVSVWIGVPLTLLAGACGMLLATTWLLFSPLRHQRRLS